MLLITQYNSCVDCSTPPTIDGGSRRFATTTYQSIVVYTCTSGYILSGSPTVSCLASGSWDNRPTCIGMYTSVCTRLRHRMYRLQYIMYDRLYSKVSNNTAIIIVVWDI